MLLFVYGCPQKLVYVKNYQTPSKFHIWTVKDNGDDNQDVLTAFPELVQPDVDHTGTRLAFAHSLTSRAVWMTDINGNNLVKITPPDSGDRPKWYPNDASRLAYWGRCRDQSAAVCQLTLPDDLSQLPSLGSAIAHTENLVFHDVYDTIFDLYQPQAADIQIVFTHREPGNFFRLYRSKVESLPGTGNPILIEPYVPQNVSFDQFSEWMPVVSFAQDVVASAVQYPGLLGIRLRGIDQQNGHLGVPLTIKFENFVMITGLAFSGKDQQIFISAKTNGGEYNIYKIGMQEWVGVIADLIPPSTPPQMPIPVTLAPTMIVTRPPGARDFGPSGIPE
jgi:hypothetical protein